MRRYSSGTIVAPYILFSIQALVKTEVRTEKIPCKIAACTNANDRVVILLWWS